MPITAAQLLIEVLGDTSDADRKLQGTSGSLDAFGRRAQEIGGKLTAYVTAPLLGIGIAAGKTAADFDTNMNVLQETSDATGAEMDLLRQKAQALGADLKLPGTSAADAAEAMLELSKAGLDVNDTLAASRGVLQLSAAGQLSNAAAAETTANALNAFNLEGSESGRVADLLAASANSSSAEVSDMADALKMASAVASSAGVPIEDVTTALGEMANAGIKGSDAGTSLKQMLLSLMAPSDKAAELMKELGVSVYDAQGNMLPMPQLIEQFSGALGGMTQEQRNAALATIFGSDAVRAANVILMQGTDAFNEMKTAVTEEGAAADLAAARMEGLGGAFENVKSAIETAMLAGVQPFKQDIEDMARGIAEAVNAFSELDEGTQKTIVSLGLMAAGAGPALMIFGKLVTTGISLVNTLGQVASVSSTVFNAFASSSQYAIATSKLVASYGAMPVTLGAVAVSVAAVVAVWMQWNEQIVKTNNEGQKAVSGAWAKFFDEQAAAGKNAAQVVDSYIAAQQRVNDQLNAANPIVRAFILDQDALAGNYDQLQQAVLAASGSYEEYQTAMMRVAQANGLVVDETGNLVNSMAAHDRAANSVVQANYLMSESQFQALETLKLMGDAAGDVSVTTSELAGTYEEATTAATDFAGAVDEVAAVTMSASDILSIMDESLSNAGWNAEAARFATQNLSVAMGETTAAAAQLDSDVRLVAEAFSLGVISSSELGTYLEQAKDGTLSLSEAERAALSAANEYTLSLQATAQAAQEAALQQLGLAASLKDATDAQIAKTAIDGLTQAFESGALPFSDYVTAVSGVQDAFGLADEKSRNLAEGIGLIVQATSDGKLPADEFAKALGELIDVAGTEGFQGFAKTFDSVPTAITPAKDAIIATKDELKELASTGQTEVQNLEKAFTEPDWEGTVGAITNATTPALEGIETGSGEAQTAIGNLQTSFNNARTVADQFAKQVGTLRDMINDLPDSKTVELITKMTTTGESAALSAVDKTVTLTIHVVADVDPNAQAAYDELKKKVEPNAIPGIIPGGPSMPRQPQVFSPPALSLPSPAAQGFDISSPPVAGGNIYNINIENHAVIRSEQDIYSLAREVVDEIQRNKL